MAITKDISIKKARLFIDYLREAGIDVSEAYLFGSVAQGLPEKDSDIDLAVVSSDFQGVRYYDIKKSANTEEKWTYVLKSILFPGKKWSRIHPNFS